MPGIFRTGRGLDEIKLTHQKSQFCDVHLLEKVDLECLDCYKYNLLFFEFQIIEWREHKKILKNFQPLEKI